MTYLLQATGLTMKYSQKKALNEMNLSLKEGSILGLLGPNGSGKTTFMKIAAGLLRPTSGQIMINGYVPGIYSKSIVAYLPDDFHLYKWMRIRDTIAFYKDFYTDFDIVKAKELLFFMELNENDKVISLSRGMQEKLSLTLVLSRRAKLYMLDEPLGGVDPVAREKIIQAILENYTENCSFIISTHLVREVEKLFDQVALLQDGRVVLHREVEELRTEKSKSIEEIYKEVMSNA